MSKRNPGAAAIGRISADRRSGLESKQVERIIYLGAMIARETALIVGAGSSIDICGSAFPTGAGLLMSIADELLPWISRGRPGSNASRAITSAIEFHCGALSDRLDYKDAARLIVSRAPAYYSIDQLVRDAADPKVTLVAKTAIAYFIGQAEAHSGPLRSTKNLTFELAENWFVQLLKSVLDDAQTLEQAKHALEKLCVVCFNYDRTLEHLFDLFMVSKYGTLFLEDNSKYLSIHHPYGTIGEISDQNQYGRSLRPDFTRNAANRRQALLTYSESDASAGLHIRQRINQCTNLVFVGFGFGEENLDLILPDDNGNMSRTVYATRNGISDPRWADLSERVQARLRRSKDAAIGAMLAARSGPMVYTADNCVQLVNDFGLRW